MEGGKKIGREGGKESKTEILNHMDTKIQEPGRMHQSEKNSTRR
jgi:hypothetical protein